MLRNRVPALLLILFTLGAGQPGSPSTPLSKRDGDRLQQKFDDIASNGAAARTQPKKTPISESELNAYLNFNLNDRMPRGLAEPEVRILDAGLLSGKVLVDFDEFNRRRQPRSAIDPLSYLSGRLPVNARGTLRTGDGKGQFQLESADIRGVPVPKPVVQELVRYFSRSPAYPKGLDIDAPFDLPARIRRIETRKGEAVVIQ